MCTCKPRNNIPLDPMPPGVRAIVGVFTALIAVFSVSVVLPGCGYVDRAVSGYTGAPTETCYEGVTYLQFTTGSTVQLDPAGKPVRCDD
jgi:hypothetical protein